MYTLWIMVNLAQCLVFNIVKINVFQVSKEPESAATIINPQTEDVKTVSLASDKVSMQNTQMVYDTHE